MPTSHCESVRPRPTNRIASKIIAQFQEVLACKALLDVSTADAYNAFTIEYDQKRRSR